MSASEPTLFKGVGIVETPFGNTYVPKLPTKPPPPPPKFVGPRKPMLPRVATEKSWDFVLGQCQYPCNVLVIDFETYFDEEYKMMGKGDGLSTVEYIKDSRFEILGCSFLKVDQPNPNYRADTFFQAGEELVETQLRLYQKLYGPNLERCTVVMQNAPFDGMILALKFGIHPPFVVDTLGLLRAWNSRTKNDLDSAAKRWDLDEKGDTQEFKGVTFRTRFKKPKSRKKGPKLPVQVPKATPEQVAKLAAYANNDVALEWELFTILLPKFSRPAVELRVMQKTLEMFTKPTLVVDFKRGDELIGLMNAEIDKVMVEAGATREEISGDKSFAALLNTAVTEAGDIFANYLKVGKLGPLLAIAKDDPQRKLLENHPNERVRKLMSARLALDSWPLHIKRVQRIMAQAKAAGGFLHVPLKYHGAHTGRDSGGEKINLQNLGSRGHDLVSAVRDLLIAVFGKKLVIADLSSIEAVVLAWLAGQADMVQTFREQFADPNAATDVYTRFASVVVGYRVRKPKKNGIPAIEKKHKDGRGLGKIGVLGCGYGMGTQRIFEYAGGSIDMDMAEKIKVAYRESNPHIVQFWRDIEKAFVYTAKYKKPCELPRGLRFDSTEDCDVICTLPSGREIHYPRVKIVEDDYGPKIEVWNDIEKHWGHVWGGHLTENVVQAMARDILMEAMLRLEDKGHRIALRVHDEIVGVEDADKAQAAMETYITELRKPPAWAPDMPLNAEGQISQCYKK